MECMSRRGSAPLPPNDLSTVQRPFPSALVSIALHGMAAVASLLVYC
jgi:hypothetical protein